MIAKLTMGAGFKGLLEYLFSQDKEPELLQTSGVRDIANPTIMSSDFISIAKQNRKVQKPVWHFSLSFSPEDKPRLDDELMVEVAERFLTKMDVGDNQYAIIKHTDTNHPHVHIIVNRVDFDGVVLQNKDRPKLRAMSAAQQLEEEYNLVMAKNKSRGYSNTVGLERYNFKPARDLVANKMKQIFKHTMEKGLTDSDEFTQALTKGSMSIQQDPVEGSDNDSTYSNLHYNYTYYDNKVKQYVETVATMPLSKVDNITMEGLDKHFKDNRVDEEKNKASITQLLNEAVKTKKLEKDDLSRKIATYLSYSGMDIKKKYVLSGVSESKLPKNTKADLNDFLTNKNIMIQALDLKQKIFSGTFSEIVFSDDLTFSFNKIDRQLIDKEKVSKFYQDYLSIYGFNKTSPVSKLLANKQANSDTIKYITNKLYDKKLPYNDLKVDEQIVRTSMILAQLKGHEKENKLLTETNKARKAIYNYSLYNDTFDDLCIYTSRRGFRIAKVNENAHVFSGDTDLGLLSSLGYRDSKKHSPVLKMMSNEDLKQVHKLNFTENNLKFYRYLDQFNIKAITSKLKGGEKFKLDQFDINHLPQDMGKELKSSFAISEARGGGGTKTIVSIKPSLKKATSILSRSLNSGKF